MGSRLPLYRVGMFCLSSTRRKKHSLKLVCATNGCMSGWTMRSKAMSLHGTSHYKAMRRYRRKNQPLPRHPRRYRKTRYWSHPEKTAFGCALRSEEHTSELQSRENLVCRLLLEKKK